jgi:hypothetical protein
MRSFFLTLVLALSLIGQVAVAKGIDERLSYFNGAIEVQILGPAQMSMNNNTNAFTVNITDAQGAPYPYITAKWVNATVQMVDMDMGVSKAKISDVLDAAGKTQGILKIEPQFAMKGQWKLNLKLTTASGNETHSINFEVR